MRIERPNGREVTRQPLDHELMEMHPGRDALEGVLPEVVQPGPLEAHIVDQVLDSVGEKDLAAMGGSTDPCGTMHVLPDVALREVCGSPVWVPMRTRTSAFAGHGWEARRRWLSTAALTASWARGKA